MNGRKKTGTKSMGKFRQKICEIVGFIISLIVIIPFLLILINSMKDKKEANRLQFSFHGATFRQMIDNYKTVFEEANMLQSFANSLAVTLLSVLVIVLCSSLAAYVTVRRKTAGIRFMDNFIIAGLTLPMAMIPTYYMLSKMGMTHGMGSMAGAVVVYTAGNFAFAYFLYRGFIKGISPEIDEAAIVEGASPLVLFFRIIMPLLKPITATVIISEAMTVWNDFTVALYLLNSPGKSTAVLTTYLYSGQRSSDWNLLFADVVMVSLPIVILFFVLQKYIVSGLSAGAVKG